MAVLSGLKPENVFRYFEEICSIPHGSTNTRKISNYLVEFAKSHKLRFIQDESNNVIIFKCGTFGYENSKPIIIQGHMDMVCEKEPGYKIDFENDALKLQLHDGVISAEGTTLGGDDGIAVAYALAILDSEDIPHPPIEAVFTVDEEIGMLGASALDCSPLTSRIMLNIDSEEEGHLLVSCAGGVTATCRLPVSYTKTTPSHIIRLCVENASGGHSGVEINKQGANANKILGRVLYDIQKDCSINIISIDGGGKDNAIPKAANAIVSLYEKESLLQLDKLLEKENSVISDEYSHSDPDISISYNLISEKQEETEVICTEDTQKVISALNLLPNGIIKMSQYIKGLVQTSLNLGIMKTHRNHADAYVSYSFSVRSSKKTEKEYLLNQMECLMNTLGGSMDLSGDYPAWEYRADSPLRNTMVEVFKEQYGYEPSIDALHAGLECGIFSDKLPGLDCISFGPDMTDIHTSNESMSVDSVIRTWNYILEVLKRLK